MRHLPTILRQVRRSSRQSGLFVLCVALSLTTLTAFSGFSRSVAAPCSMMPAPCTPPTLSSGPMTPFLRPLLQAIGRLVDQQRIERANVHEFYSVVRAPDEKHRCCPG
jgi:putative ABC transport system permease protein